MAELSDKEKKKEAHFQQIERHYAALGRENPFADHYAMQRSMRDPSSRKGGLGGNKGAAKYQNTSAEDRAAANSDGKFGYFDEVNKRYVPAIFDAMDGGGRDTRGDTFEGGIFSGMLNDMGVKPYGSQMERAMVSPNTSPIVQAVNAVPQGITDAQRTSAAMAEEARQRGLRQDFPDDPRLGMTQNSPITMGPADYQVYAMERDRRNQAAAAEQARMAAIIDEARGLASRSGLNFDTMPQERQAEFINAVRFGMGGPTSGRF